VDVGYVVLYELWGGFGLFLGLVLLGVGSVPIACLALLFSGKFSSLGAMVLTVAMVFALRFFGAWIADKEATRRELAY
jgi:hypothetical protein